MCSRVLYQAMLCIGMACLHLEGAAESLYREDSFRSWVSDAKALTVGDVITVQVYEISSVSTSTDLNTQRKNNVSVAATSMGNTARQRSIGLDTNGDFQGGGTVQRASRLLATLTVTIRQTLGNGDFVVDGDQVLLINGEKQYVSISGRVRPQDIDEKNTIISTRLADARITFSGEGDLSDRQKKVWWRTVLDWLGL